MNNIDILYQQYLQRLYSQKIDLPKRKIITETQGEILFPSVCRLLQQFPLNNKDIFYDLGSGSGKFVMQVFLLTNVAAAIGIEIIHGLHQQAMLAKQRLQEDMPHECINRELEFFAGSFFDLSFASATVIFINCICFTQPMLQQLAQCIDKLSNIRLILSLRPLLTLQGLKCFKVIRIEGSWDSALCYVYIKDS